MHTSCKCRTIEKFFFWEKRVKITKGVGIILGAALLCCKHGLIASSRESDADRLRNWTDTHLTPTRRDIKDHVLLSDDWYREKMDERTAVEWDALIARRYAREDAARETRYRFLLLRHLL